MFKNISLILIAGCSAVVAGVDHLKATKDLKGSGVEVVKVYTEWCGFCKMIKADYEKLAQEFANVHFVEILADNAKDFTREHNISGFPTFVIMKDGKKVDTVVGANIEGLKRKVAEHSGAKVEQASKVVKETPRKEMTKEAPKKEMPTKKAAMPEKKKYVKRDAKRAKKNDAMQQEGEGCRNECTSCHSCKTC